MNRELGITEVRKQISLIVDLAEHKGESCVIVRHGQPSAVVVPMEVYLHWKKEREDIVVANHATQVVNRDVNSVQVIDVLDV